MLSNERKEKVLEALYAAASDPRRYEEFLKAIDALLEGQVSDDFGSWLEPHIQTAISINEKLSFAGLLDRSSNDIVRNFGEPAAIITATGEIVASNSEWDARAKASHLDQITDLDDDRINIRNAVRSMHAILEDRTKLVRIESAECQIPILTLRRLPVVDQRYANGGIILVRGLGFAWSDGLKRFICDLFGLTEVEFKSLQLIVDGKKLSEIAAEIGRGRETVKSHTKSIYSKLGVSGREELTKTVLQLYSLLGARPERAVPPTKITGRSGKVALNSGNTIFWQDKGAQNGRRILFLHGLSLGHHFSKPFEAALEAADITLVCIERPGYGRSDPPKNWKKGIEEWIDLYPDLNRKLGLDVSPIVTQTGGVMLAAAAAAFYPNLVSGICAFAAGVPITDSKKLAKYPVQVRLISRAASISPYILRFILTNGTHYFRTPEGRARTIERTYASSPVDREGLKDPAVREQVQASIEMIADGGYDGFTSDNLHMFGDWSRYPKLAKCEIRYLNGTEDPICPLEWSWEFAGSLPNMTVSVAKGAGNLMLHTHPERCVAHLRDCLSRFGLPH